VTPKRPLAELRQLVRGFHPAILEDRGLARRSISSGRPRVGARRPWRSMLPVRPAAAVESAAYFVVTEALANMAKHSQATRVAVTIRRQADRLVVEITDNGKGGRPTQPRAPGSPAWRSGVAGHGGWMQVLSPPGWTDHHISGASMPIVIAEDSVLRIVIAEDSVLLPLRPHSVCSPTRAKRSSPQSVTGRPC